MSGECGYIFRGILIKKANENHNKLNAHNTFCPLIPPHKHPGAYNIQKAFDNRKQENLRYVAVMRKSY